MLVVTALGAVAAAWLTDSVWPLVGPAHGVFAVAATVGSLLDDR